jgi:hypothetical protein
MHVGNFLSLCIPSIDPAGANGFHAPYRLQIRQLANAPGRKPDGQRNPPGF